MHAFRLFASALATLAGLLAGAAWAQAPAGAIDENLVRAFVSQQVAATGGDTVSRFDVRLGNLDPHLQLAPCRRTEAFLPASGRLWGRSSVGVRCADGANWTVMLPVTVVAWGRALVAAQPLAAGALLSAQDLREQEIELTREPAGLARDVEKLVGRTLTRSLAPGQPIRADMTRTTSVVNAGDPVRLHIKGAGFAVSAGAQALTAAGDGQPVRVRTELGKILTGVAREGRLVEVAL